MTSRVNFDYLRSLVIEHSDTFRLEGTSKLRIVNSSAEAEKRLEIIKNILTEMEQHYEQ